MPPTNLPFDADYLDTLLLEAGLDAVLLNTKHNVQYLLGGYRYFFFAQVDAIGVSRYLPALGIVRGKSEDAFYIGAGNEDWGTEKADLWVPDIQNTSWTTTQSAKAIVKSLRDRGLNKGTVGIEKSFFPADAYEILLTELPEAHFVEAHRVLESLRAVKNPAELVLVRDASVGIIESMDAVFATVQPGMTKFEISELFRLEQTKRGLYFEYALVTCGTDMNRNPFGPSGQDRWQSGTSLSIDSGGALQSYIGDLSRMGVDTEPTPRMMSLLDQLESVQQAARTAVSGGKLAEGIYVAANEAIAQIPDADIIRFVAHGMGLVTHEAPRLTDVGPIPYPADHRKSPLQPGWVLSIESWFEDPMAGFIKLEDTLIVTDDGWEAPGDELRGWNRTGA